MKKNIRNSQGQALVEFALILPVFILILVGLLQFGLVFFYSLTLNEAAREGARFAAVNGLSDIPLIQQTVVNYASGLAIDPADVKVTSEIKTVPSKHTVITVSVNKELDAIAPLIQSFIPATKLNGTVYMRLENN